MFTLTIAHDAEGWLLQVTSDTSSHGPEYPVRKNSSYIDQLCQQHSPLRQHLQVDAVTDCQAEAGSAFFVELSCFCLAAVCFFTPGQLFHTSWSILHPLQRLSATKGIVCL